MVFLDVISWVGESSSSSLDLLLLDLIEGERRRCQLLPGLVVVQGLRDAVESTWVVPRGPSAHNTPQGKIARAMFRKPVSPFNNCRYAVFKPSRSKFPDDNSDSEEPGEKP